MEKGLVSLAALQEEAAAFARALAPRDTATLVTLSGELGAGKTSFAQGMAAALGVTDHVTSPTFVLEKVYDLEGQAFKRLVHIDAYRLEDGKGLAPLGFDEIMQDPGNLVVLEWPERVRDGLPTPAYELRFAVAGDGRTLTYAG